MTITAQVPGEDAPDPPTSLEPRSSRGSGSNAIWSLLPTLAFLLVDRWSGLAPAILVASLASILASVIRSRRGGGVGLLLPMSLGYVAVRGVVAVWAGSEDVYFGFGLALTAIAALVIGATAFTRQPAALYVMPLAASYREQTMEHPLYRRVASHLTLAWAGMELAITGWEAWHLTGVSATQFVLLKSLVGWPVMAGWLCFLVFYLRLRLDPVQHALTGDVPPRWGNASLRVPAGRSPSSSSRRTG